MVDAVSAKYAYFGINPVLQLRPSESTREASKRSRRPPKRPGEEDDEDFDSLEEDSDEEWEDEGAEGDQNPPFPGAPLDSKADIANFGYLQPGSNNLPTNPDGRPSKRPRIEDEGDVS